jgi:outer membrane protein assembly factor BamB
LECIVAYDLRRGSEIWAYGDSARFSSWRTGVGPRSTPVVDGAQVYALGATGWLRCLDAADGGRLLWRRHVGAAASAWGLWASPLLWRDLVIVANGRGEPLQAFDRQSGEPRWQANTPAGDGAPLLARATGMELVVLSGTTGASGHEPATGVALWRRRWAPSVTVASTAVPLPAGRLLLGGGRGGMRLVDVRRDLGAAGLVAALLWRAPHLRPTLSSVVEADGFLYGLDDGRLVCLEAATGYRRWLGPRFGQGRLLLADDAVLVQSETGDIALVAREPTAFRQLLRFHASDTDRGWAPPLQQGRWLVVRGEGQATLWELP